MNNYYPGNNNGGNLVYTYPNTSMQQLPAFQPLTQEEINKLREEPKFSIQIDEKDMLRAYCGHQNPDGSSALKMDADGSFVCDICKSRLKLNAYSEEEVREMVDNIINIINVSKLTWRPPNEVARQYYQIIPLLELFKKIWSISNEHFNRYISIFTSGNDPIQSNPFYSNNFNTLNNLLFGYGQPAMAGYGQPAMPGYGQPQMPAQPMPYGNPVMGYAQQPNMGYPQTPVQPMGYDNPMAYGAPAQPQQPMQPAQAPQAGVMPQPTAQQGEVVQNQTFDV